MLIILKLTMIILFICVIFPTSAYAYLDPSVGSILAQIAVAAGVGIMFYFRKIKDFIERLKTGFSKTDTKKTDVEKT